MKMKAVILHSQDEAPIYMNDRGAIVNYEYSSNTPVNELPDIHKKSEGRMV